MHNSFDCGESSVVSELSLPPSTVLASSCLASCDKLRCNETKAELLVMVAFVVLLDDECMASVLFGKARKESESYKSLLIRVSNLGYEKLVESVRNFISMNIEFGGPLADRLNEVMSALPLEGRLSSSTSDE
jgi:hypothetical protein